MIKNLKKSILISLLIYLKLVCGAKLYINGFNNMINETIDNLPMLKEDSESYKKVVDFIHKKKSVTKKEILDYLGWGVRISFSWLS